VTILVLMEIVQIRWEVITVFAMLDLLDSTVALVSFFLNKDEHKD